MPFSFRVKMGKIRDPNLTRNARSNHAKTATQPHVEPAPPRGLQFSYCPSQPRGGPNASLRVLLPRLQENNLKGADACRIRGRRGPLSALRAAGAGTQLLASGCRAVDTGRDGDDPVFFV